MEGTIAHGLGELEVSRTFGLITNAKYLDGLTGWRADFDAQGYGPDTLAEMQEHVRQYVRFVGQRQLRYPGSQIKVEQKLDTGVPDSWGTSDIVIFSAKHVEIIDLKYGVGIPVDAEGNSQLRLYACGALDAFGDVLDTTEEVYMTVFQPRLDSHSTEMLSADDLRAWRDEVAIPKALETQSPNASFGPSEKACRFCPVAGICRVRMEATIQEDFGEFGTAEPRPPEVLTPEELGGLLHRLPAIRAYTDAVAMYAADQTKRKADAIPGWKVVATTGNRFIQDPAVAIQTLLDAGRSHTEVAEVKIKPLGELEKLLGGRKKFDEVLGSYVGKKPAGTKLVPESDKRDAVNPVASAVADFKEE